MEWQPIETAPKDGTLILACKDGETFLAWWYPHIDMGYAYQWCFVGIGEIYQEEVNPNAYDADHAPIHWMPLPEAVKEPK